MGKVGGSGGASTFTINCGQGSKIAGITGTYDDYLVSLNAVCSKPSSFN